MGDRVRDVFGTMSDTVFPGSRNLINQGKANFIDTGNYLLSDVALQVALYLNCFYSPCWFITCVVHLNVKYTKLNQVYKFVLVVVYIVMGFIEIARLYLGYAGNLQEKVPELAGFWLVTFILQLPLTCFLLFNTYACVLAMEGAVNSIMLAFLLFQVVQGYRTVKRMTDAQVQKFQLKHLHNDADVQQLAGQAIENIEMKKYD